MSTLRLLALGLLAAVGTVGCAQQQQSFDSSTWAAWSVATKGGADVDSPRLAMVPDLERRYLRKGIELRDVLSLLGPPDRPIRRPEVCLWYYVGASERGVFASTDYLLLFFDASDRLTGWEIRQAD